MSMKIPPKYKAGVKQLIELDDSSIDEILKALKEISPSLQIEILNAKIANRVEGVKSKEVGEILSFILSLYSLMNEYDISQDSLVNDITDAIEKSPEDFSDVTELSLQLFKDRLSTFLEQGGLLSILSKAVNVILEHERVFFRSRIISDLRPIFDNDPEENPTTASIIHNLKIEYREGDELKEFFVALDSIDVKQIMKQLERAEKKAQTLKKLLTKAEVIYLDMEEEE